MTLSIFLVLAGCNWNVCPGPGERFHPSVAADEFFLVTDTGSGSLYEQPCGDGDVYGFGESSDGRPWYVVSCDPEWCSPGYNRHLYCVSEVDLTTWREESDEGGYLVCDADDSPYYRCGYSCDPERVGLDL